jgi:hypothetical protein
MILVSGTMRSGTSMWMQVLVAAGLPWIGEAFAEPWATRISAANPRGFYESQLAAGVYHATNPHAENAAYLLPGQTRRHVVKVFVPGLVRTDVAFVDHVVATMRRLREYAAALLRVRAMAGEDREGAIFDLPLSPALRWWIENFALVRDIATRRYPAHVVIYGRVLRDPGREVGRVPRWIGAGNPAAARPAVEPALQTQAAAAAPAVAAALGADGGLFAATRSLVDGLLTGAPRKNREEEARKARERSAVRFGRIGEQIGE